MIHLALAVGLLGFQQPETFDFSKVNRELVSEPAYTGTPRYALILLGPDDRHRVWLAVDESKPGAAHYDVLYADLDGDGKLGEPGERFGIASRHEDRWTFEPGPVAIAGCDLKVDRFRVNYYFEKETRFFFLTLRIDQKVRLYGGSRQDLRFGDSRASAPVLRAHPYGPLTLRLTLPDHLRPGSQTKLTLNAGIPGSTPDAYLAVDERFLDLENGKLTADLVARSAGGKDVKKTFRLKNYC
jgi:hypothetical protein